MICLPSFHLTFLGVGILFNRAGERSALRQTYPQLTVLVGLCGVAVAGGLIGEHVILDETGRQEWIVEVIVDAYCAYIFSAVVVWWLVWLNNEGTADGAERDVATNWRRSSSVAYVFAAPSAPLVDEDGGGMGASAPPASRPGSINDKSGFDDNANVMV